MGLDILHCSMYTGSNNKKRELAMHQKLIIPLIILFSSSAWAQAYPPQYQPPAAEQQASVANPYTTQPYYAPAAVQPPLVQQPPANEPRAGEYGQSVMTDIRQMNF